jgi:hypothetical protein
MAPKSKSKPKSTVSCRFFKQGRCRYSAAKCRFAHVLPQTSDKASTNTHGVSHTSLMNSYLGVLPTSDDKGDAETIKSGYGASSSAANEYRVGDGGNWNGQTYRYCPQTFSNAETRNFSSNSTWDMKKLDEGGIKRVCFGPDFNVHDTHLAAICCRPDLASSLLSLSLGDSDSGNGAGLTDHGVIVLVQACPNLRELTLSAATKLTDEAFLAICKACPSIESLCITGNDKVKGRLTSASLKKLMDSPDLVPKLKRLVLWDQNYMEDVKVLSSARLELAIETGETLGDGIAANMIAAMTGGAQTRTWLAGKVVDVHTDPGWYGPGMMDFPDFGGGLMAPWDSDDTDDEGDPEEDQEIEEDEDDYMDEHVYA